MSPFFMDFLHRQEIGENVELEWLDRRSGRDVPMGPRQLSDGTLRFACLATLLNQPEELLPNLILIDEPELGLHPYAITLLAEMLKRSSASSQIVITTQSADLISELDVDDIVTVSQRNGQSVFERLDASHLDEWLADYSLGELWRMNVIGRGPE